jgi:uncharacterized membrane protein
MKIRFDKYSVRFLTAIAGTFLLGVVLCYSPYPWIGGTFIIVGLMLCVMFLYVSSKPPEHFIRDERSVRVTEKAGYHAFWILLVSTSVLNAPGSPFRTLYVKDISAPLFLIGLYSWLILKWYYNKRGFEKDP